MAVNREVVGSNPTRTVFFDSLVMKKNGLYSFLKEPSSIQEVLLGGSLKQFSAPRQEIL